MMPAAAPRCRTSRESAGEGQGASASQTGVPVMATVSAAARAEAFAAEAIVVADQDAFAGLLGAHDVARDGAGHLADVFDGEIVGDDAAPAVGAEANGGHRLTG